VADLVGSARLKVGWARAHLSTLDHEAATFLGTQQYRLAVEPTAWGHVVRAHVIGAKVGPPPLRLSLIAGDVIHNLRAALDHLANAVATKPVGEGPGDRTAFPLFVRETEYNRQEQTYLKGVRASERPRFRSLQPYHAVERIGWGPELSPAEPLYLNFCLMLLSRLDNADKHRLLVPANAVTTFKRVRFVNARSYVPLDADGAVRVEDGAVLLRIAKLELESGTTQVVLRPLPKVELMFGDIGLHAMDLLPNPNTNSPMHWPGDPKKVAVTLATLHQIADAVDSIIGSFEPLFTPPA
jgi:hypothetical protein